MALHAVLKVLKRGPGMNVTGRSYYNLTLS